MDAELLARARLHAALGEPHRLAIVDGLFLSDRAPSELASMLSIDTNLLAHHLGILEGVGLIERVGSQADRRRRYLRLVPTALADVQPGPRSSASRVVFVCTENAARSQLAQAIWNHSQTIPAASGGIDPAPRVYPGAVRAARRRGLDLTSAQPRPLPTARPGDLVVTVCDRAHEHLRRHSTIRHLHWSIPDPAASRAPDTYDRAAETLSGRIKTLAAHVEPRPADPHRKSDEEKRWD